MRMICVLIRARWMQPPVRIQLATAHMEAELKWVESAIKKVKNDELP